MNPTDHQAAALRIERSIAKCLATDHELLIEAAMLAGSHRLNGLLHAAGATQEGNDVMHTYLLTINECRRLAVAAPEAVAALSEIEDMRPAFVRGTHPGGSEAAQRALQLLSTIRTHAQATARANP